MSAMSGGYARVRCTAHREDGARNRDGAGCANITCLLERDVAQRVIAARRLRGGDLVGGHVRPERLCEVEQRVVAVCAVCLRGGYSVVPAARRQLGVDGRKLRCTYAMAERKSFPGSMAN
jgi:hypothetical protein